MWTKSSRLWLFLISHGMLLEYERPPPQAAILHWEWPTARVGIASNIALASLRELRDGTGPSRVGFFGTLEIG